MLLEAGARLLQPLLQGIAAVRPRAPVRCRCGRRMRSVGRRAKTFQTLLGPVRLTRSLFVCPRCRASRFPADERLGLAGAGHSPGVRRLAARAGCQAPFAAAADDLRVYAEMSLSPKAVERLAAGAGRRIEAWTAAERSRLLDAARRSSAPPRQRDLPILYVSWDGTGVPMRAAELHGRRGKDPAGRARTRELKLGCVFTQTGRDDAGRPVRDPGSTTYVGAIETSEDFGWRLYGEALRRGLDRARRVVLLTDAARYNLALAQLHFPHATLIIDLYHAREHLYRLADLLLRGSRRAQRLAAWIDALDAGAIPKLLAHARRLLPRRGPRHAQALTEIHFFRDHAPYMRYAEFRAQGFFVGSGVIEAGCRSLVGLRLKQSGMFWSVSGANAITALRCCLASGRFEQFCEDQVA